MVTRTKIAPLIVIVGETASGKSELALYLAKKFGGEIIAGDSRTVYKGMDIGTAKPDLKTRKTIPHHLIDISTPNEPVNVSDFKRLAQKAIAEVDARGRVPILAGGSGLYIDAILFDFSFRGGKLKAKRAELENLSSDQLRRRIVQSELTMPSNFNNRRHLTREIEAGGRAVSNNKLRSSTLIIGLKPNPEVVKANINKRVNKMLQDGLEKEVGLLSERYGWDIEPLRTIGYQEFRAYMSGQQTLDNVIDDINRATYRYAKRQRTWFMRNKHIHWVEKRGQAVDLVTTFLNK